MKLTVRNAEGRPLKQLEVDDSVFGIEPNIPVLHQAFVTGRNNQRWGTAQTKTRGLVQGSTRKIRRQKYTGRARQGSIRAPHHVGGGVVFGPVQRSYAQALPKKMKRLAIRSALSGKVADGQLVVIDQLAMESPKTKQVLTVLRSVGIERSALVVTAETDRAIIASLRNVPKTKVLPAAYLNVVDMLNHHTMLMTEDAVRVAEKLWAVEKREKPAAPAKPAARKARAVKEKAAPEPAAEVVTEAPTEEAPKPRRRAAPKAEKAPEPKAAAEAKPARAARKPKAEAKAAVADEPAEKKPARAARKPKAEAAAKPETEKKPAPRRRTKKSAGEE